jgi:hypothetical protein
MNPRTTAFTVFFVRMVLLCVGLFALAWLLFGCAAPAFPERSMMRGSDAASPDAGPVDGGADAGTQCEHLARVCARELRRCPSCNCSWFCGSP